MHIDERREELKISHGDLLDIMPGLVSVLLMEEIFCPHCGEGVCNDEGEWPVSYYGSEDGPIEMSCQSCGKIFYIDEQVERTYEVRKTEEEIEDEDDE